MAGILDAKYRKQIIEETKTGENKNRKARSWKQYRVMCNDYEQYVAEKLAGHLDDLTVIEMPKIASINVAEKICNKTAVVYKKGPKRTFGDISEDDLFKLDEIYKDGKFDKKLRSSNKSFKYQNQNLLQVVPRNGKLVLKSLKLHQYDVIPKDDDPEEAKTIIMSVNNREIIDQETYLTKGVPTGFRGASNTYQSTRDYVDQEIADEDDYKKMLERYVVWDLESQTNFVCNGHGHVQHPETGEFLETITEDLYSLILSPFIVETERLPFVDISKEKDFTYFVRDNHSVTDFTIDFNAALSDYADTNHMQSKAQAIIKGPADLIANEIQIGSHLVLRLIKQFDEQGREIDMDFSYANPNPDMAGAKEFIESLLSLYLSSRDVDSSEITTRPQTDRYSSGFERFLAIFETFSASQEDFDTYTEAEEEIFEIIKGWLAVARDTTDLIDPYYIPSSSLEDSDIVVEFNRPEEVKSTMEKLDEIQKEIEMGLTSRVKALSRLKGISEDQARDLIMQIDAEEGANGVEQSEIQAQ